MYECCGRYEIPDMSHVAIVTFSSRAALAHGLTLVTRDAGTRLRLADAVPDTANKLSASQAGCVRCGVRTAMEQVLRSREAGGHVILVTAEDESPGGLDSLATDAITEYINYYNLRVSSVVLGPAAPPPAFSALAALSGGVASSVQLRPSPRAGARDPSVWTLASLGRGLVAAVKVDRAAGARIPETVHLVSGHHNIVTQWTSQVSTELCMSAAHFWPWINDKLDIRKKQSITFSAEIIYSLKSVPAAPGLQAGRQCWCHHPSWSAAAAAWELSQ